jgi:hypothetical protein
MCRQHFTAGHIPLYHEPEVSAIGDIADEDAIDERENIANEDAETQEYDDWRDEEAYD